MIRKGQARWVSGSDVRRQIQFINRLFEVVAWYLDIQAFSVTVFKIATLPYSGLVKIHACHFIGPFSGAATPPLWSFL